MEELLADDLTTVDFENVLRGTVLLGDAHVLREVGAESRRHSGAHHQVTIDANHPLHRQTAQSAQAPPRNGIGIFNTMVARKALAQLARGHDPADASAQDESGIAAFGHWSNPAGFTAVRQRGGGPKPGARLADNRSGTFAAGRDRAAKPGGAPLSESGTLSPVNRLFRILLLALLLGPSIGPVVQPIQEVCAEEHQDCCEPDGVCDHTCADCACCAGSAISLSSPALAKVLNGPPVPTVAARTATPPSAPPSDILHVPKSV
jgi:hypothetical protein